MPLISQNPNKQAGLVKASPSADIPQPIVTQRISKPEFKGVAVDLRWVNRSDLLTHVEGSSWIVDYYSQVLDTDSNLSGQQLSVSPEYQQYEKIRAMEIKVQQALTTSQDDDTKGMRQEGSAIVYPFMIPNEGDMFVADIGEGKRGVFRVTGSRKLSIYKEACYEIVYSIDTDALDKQEDLEDKTVKEVVFHKDYMNMGKSPLLLTSQHATLLSVQDVYATLATQYFQRFFSDEFKTLLVPFQARSTYDPFLVRFLLSQFGTQDSHEIRYIREFFMGGDPAMEVHNLWTALANRNPAFLKTSFMRVGTVDTRVFSSVPQPYAIRFTGVRRSLYPLDPQLVIDNRFRPSCSPLVMDPLDAQPAPVGGLYAMIEAINTAVMTPTAGTIKPVLTDDYYVLSEDFYKKQDGMDTLEGIVWQYLEGKPMDAPSLVATAQLWPTWGLLEQFYYIPILMHLLRSIIHGE